MKNPLPFQTLLYLMKLTLFQVLLAVIFTGVSLAYDASAQELLDKRVSVRLENQGLRKVLKEIETQTNIRFAFRPREIPVDLKITLVATNESLRDVLDKTLKPLRLQYEVVGRQIVLSPATLPTEPSGKQEEAFGVATEKADRTITGTVKSETGEGLPGVSVVIKSTTRGTTTDADGKYRLNVADTDLPNATLVFSFVGYESQEVVLGNRTSVDVQLSPDNKSLDEVVVVGYGKEQKKDLTGAVSTVSAKDIATRQTLQVSDALQGAMAGVAVTRNNGAPGATSTITLRGITTIGNNAPLIIIDGVPNDNLNNVSPNDIESITVLKDAASASIYGSRAAAGVVLVTTKRAKTGQANFEYSFNYGLQTPTRLPKYVGAVRYMQLFNEFTSNDGGKAPYNQQLIDSYAANHSQNPDVYPDTDWQSRFLYSSAPRQDHNLAFRIGSERVKTQASLGYSTANGLYPNKSFTRYSLRVNNDLQIGKKLDANIDLSFVRNQYIDPAGESTLRDRNGFYTARNVPPIYSDQYLDGRWGTGKDGINPVAQVNDGGTDQTVNNQLIARFGINFKPLEGLTLTGVAAPRYDFNKSKSFSKIIQYTDLSDPSRVLYRNQANTILTEARPEGFTFNGQFLVNYVKTLGSQHNLDALAGYEENYNYSESLTSARTGYTLTSFPYLDLGSLALRDNSGAASEYALRSFFGRLKYNYQNKYYLQANLRYDGSSRFNPNYRWALFPSFSAGWAISEEPFLRQVKSLSFLKLRASWGQVGNERIGNYPYQASIVFNNAIFYQGGQKVSAGTGAQSVYAIPNISWETAETFDVGLDASFFGNKLNLTADYYNKNTRNILLTLDIPRFLGYANPNQNAGRLNARGWELELSWRDQKGDFRYSVAGNLSDSKTQLVDLKGTQLLGDKAQIQGGEFNEWFGYRSAGLFQTQEEVNKSAVLNANTKPGDIKYVDIDGDGKITSDKDKVLLGGSLPRYIYGGTVSVGYKRLDFSVVFQGVGKVLARRTSVQAQPFLEGFGNVSQEIDGKFWSVTKSADENRQARYPRLSQTSSANNYTMSDFWLISGAYLRVKNLTVGYDLSPLVSKKLHMQGLRLFVAANDVFSLNRFPTGWDPEVDATTYPIVRTFMAGVSAKF
ncbi:TonB-dependent receptor [Spirosoma daeguense]